MDKKTIAISGIAFIALNMLVGLGVFVKFPDMTAYAVSKSEFATVISRLDRIENKLDRLIESKR